MIRATIDGLQKEASPRQTAARRGKKVAEILKRPDADVKSDTDAVEA
jgi:small subunit ribosomal protein S5